MHKTSLIEAIRREGRWYFKNGSSRKLHAGEIQIVIDAINSVWPDDPGSEHKHSKYCGEALGPGEVDLCPEYGGTGLDS